MSSVSNRHEDLQAAMKVLYAVQAKVRTKQREMSKYASKLAEQASIDAIFAMVRSEIAELCMRYYADQSIACAHGISDYLRRHGSLLCVFVKNESMERDPKRDYQSTLVFAVGYKEKRAVVTPVHFAQNSGEKVLQEICERLRSDPDISAMAAFEIQNSNKLAVL